MAKVSKRYKALSAKVEDRKYSLADACNLVRDLKSAKFDESVEIALNLNVDPRHADQMIIENLLISFWKRPSKSESP